MTDESRVICFHCNSTFKNKTVLQTHIKTNKKCLYHACKLKKINKSWKIRWGAH